MCFPINFYLAQPTLLATWTVHTCSVSPFVGTIETNLFIYSNVFLSTKKEIKSRSCGVLLQVTFQKKKSFLCNKIRVDFPRQQFLTIILKHNICLRIQNWMHVISGTSEYSVIDDQSAGYRDANPSISGACTPNTTADYFEISIFCSNNKYKRGHFANSTVETAIYHH